MNNEFPVQFSFPAGQTPLWAGIGIGVILLAYFGLRLSDRHRARRLSMLVDASLAPRMLEGYDVRVRRPLTWFTLAGVLFLLLAFAQPRWGRSWVEVARTGRDIMILLDTSESMNAQNPAPTRLDRARQKIESLMDKCPGDRFGLIAFAGQAVLQSPLTLDHNYLRAVLDAVSTDTLNSEGSVLASALKEAKRVFDEETAKSGDERKHSRVIMVISDGEQTSDDAIKTASEMKNEACIFVLGIGDPEGATITFPTWMQRYAQIPENKRTHLSKLDEATLSKLASDNGGAYVRITPDDADVGFIHDELEQIQTKAISGQMRYNLVNRYRWPLSAATACFAAEGLWICLMPLIRSSKIRKQRRAIPHG